jgi:hypothetical protein
MQDLVWRDSKLYFGRRVVGEIVPDSKYLGMWRIMRPDGSLSDMVNRTRAKDACEAAFFGTDRQERRRRQSHLEARTGDILLSR